MQVLMKYYLTKYTFYFGFYPDTSQSEYSKYKAATKTNEAEAKILYRT